MAEVSAIENANLAASSYFVDRPKGVSLQDHKDDKISGWAFSDVQAAFKLFDKDGDGTISAPEMRKILTRQGTGKSLTEEDAQLIINDFDRNGDGVLQVAEFARAISTIGDDVMANKEYLNSLYDRRVEPHKYKIQQLFDRLDKDRSGQLEMDEIKEVVSTFEGEDFDEPTFLEWYDTNHEIKSKADGGTGGLTTDGVIDIVEFGWYIADQASCEEEKMPPTIERMNETIDYILSKRAA